MNYITGTLKDVTREVDIPWDPSNTDLMITTDSSAGNNDHLWVDFFYKTDIRSGAFEIEFLSPMTYKIGAGVCSPWAHCRQLLL